MRKRGIAIIFLASLLVLTVFLFSSHLVSADNNVCCEKLSNAAGGQWCQNAPASSCNASFQMAPTACESTSFCKPGTCYGSTGTASQAGLCNEGVSQIVCQNNGGAWSDQRASALAQCQLGCCYLGSSQALLSTQVRCKQLSSNYGVNTSWDSSITSETQCIASAGGDTKGACVYQTGGERTCRLTTKTGCNNLQSNGSVSGVTFYPNDLCSNEELHTNCGPSKQTTCVVGQDAVYFVDTCGNVANVYDASRANDPTYWATIIPKSDSCSNSSSNINNPSCGNCDFVLGSTCAPAQRGQTQPVYGNNICKDLGCNYNGKYYQQGESWCALTPGTTTITDQNQNGSYTFGSSGSTPNSASQNIPGSVYEKLTCYDGQVNSEFCGDGRQQTCVQDTIQTSNGPFSNAACELNRWQDCYSQTNETSCLDRTQRDCQWISNTFPYGTQNTQGAKKSGACAPLNAPGFDFYNGSGNGDTISSLGTIICPYKIEYSVAGGYKITEGGDCLTLTGNTAHHMTNQINPQWVQGMYARCIAIGDSGPKTNYLGYPGETQVIAEKITSGNATTNIISTNGNGIIKVDNGNGIAQTYKSWSNFIRGIIG